MVNTTIIDNLKPKIIVVGVGGAGGNAINNMINSSLEGVDFMAANTDAQALRNSKASIVVQLGLDNTRGLGAGARPDVGRMAAEEVEDEIRSHLAGSNMLFITAGMGGGTGTGAAPIIGKIAREMGILTIGVVTKPFNFEGTHRMRLAEEGIQELQEHVDTLIIIPNQNLFRLANQQTTFADAFNMVDNVLYAGVRSVTDLMIMPGLVNLDFADVKTTMSEMGKAMMGTGEGQGPSRAVDAAEAAIANPLLEEMSLRTARAVLVNVTGGFDMTLFEVDEAVNRVREEAPEAKLIFGATFDDRLQGTLRVAVVATGIEGGVAAPSAYRASGEARHSTMATSHAPAQTSFSKGQSELNFGDEPVEEFTPPPIGNSYASEKELSEFLPVKEIDDFSDPANSNEAEMVDSREKEEHYFASPSPSISSAATSKAAPDVVPPKKGFFTRLGLGKKSTTSTPPAGPVQSGKQKPSAVKHDDAPVPLQPVIARRQSETASPKPVDHDLEVPAFLRRKHKNPDS